jgi:DNA-binding GntR family transcriptional regulator
MEFHLRLAHLSGMPLLERELRRAWLRKMMDITWLSATRLMRIPEQWHVQLVEAIATRNPDIAERAARGHVQYGTDTVRESLRGTTQNLQSLSQKGSNADAETI